MKAFKVLGKVVLGIILLIVVAIVGFVILLSNAKKQAEADCVMIEELAETIEEALDTESGSSARYALSNVTEGYGNFNFYITKGGCSVNVNGQSPQAREALASMEATLDSVNPDWRSEYRAKGSSQYEIFVKSGSGEIIYKNVPFGFGK